MDDLAEGATQKPMSDDQDLAKALAGVMPDAPEPAPTDQAATSTSTDDSAVSQPAPEPPVAPVEETPAPAPVAPTVAPEPTVAPTMPTAPTGDLDSIKSSVIGELKPLVDKVDLPAEEKFDTYLMLIRNTDDSSLIAPAHAAAQAISDETRRAEALLDIIKEIDYLSHKDKPTA